MTAILITLIIISSILLVIASIYLIIKAKIETVSKNILGTTNIFEVFKSQELKLSNTPKSLSSLDSVEVPKILKDFPDFDINEMKSIAENAVVLFYKSLEKHKFQKIPNATDKLNNKINYLIEKLDKSYNNLKIHKTVINSYKKISGMCILTMQSSLEYMQRKGQETKKIQTRVNTEFIYVYDDDKLNEKYGLSLNCKNCGAPIKSLGVKSCPYCGTGVLIPSKIWKIDDIKNV